MNEFYILKSTEDTYFIWDICRCIKEIFDIITIPAFNDDDENFIVKMGELLKLKATVLLYDEALQMLKNNGFESLNFDHIYRHAISNNIIKTPNYETSETMQNENILIVADNEAFPDALKYSLLTNRKIYSLKSKKLYSLIKNAGTAFLFLSNSITAEQLRNIYHNFTKNVPTIAIGVFYNLNPKLSHKILIKSYFFSCCQKEIPVYNYFYPLVEKNTMINDGIKNIIYGKQRDNIIQALTNPSEISFSLLHSNGVDMNIGDVLICARENYNDEDIPTKCHPCFYEGVPCSRMNEKRILIAPSSIKSKILILYTCWGIILNDGIYDVRISLAQQFMKSPYTAVFVSTYTMSYFDDAAGNKIVDMYYEGYNIGTTIAEYNRIHYQQFRDSNSTLIVFGDPTICVHSKEMNEELIIKKIVSKEPIILPFDKNFFSIIYYSELLAQGMNNLNIPTLNKKTEELLLDLRNIRLTALKLNSRYINKKKLTIMQEKMLMKRLYANLHKKWYLAYREQVIHIGGLIRFQVDSYLPYTYIFKHLQKCPYCGSITEYHKKKSKIPEMYKYQIECINCATTIDSTPKISFDSKILCETYIHKGKCINLSVKINFINIKPIYCSAGVILEPYCKGKDSPVSEKFIAFENINENTEVEFIFEDFKIDEIQEAGCRYLNCIVCADEQIAILRRLIYLIK